MSGSSPVGLFGRQTKTRSAFSGSSMTVAPAMIAAYLYIEYENAGTVATVPPSAKIRVSRTMNSSLPAPMAT